MIEAKSKHKHNQQKLHITLTTNVLTTKVTQNFKFEHSLL